MSLRPTTLALVPTLLLAASSALGQSVTDGSDAALGERAGAVIALVGKGLKAPGEARYSRLRPGRAEGVCGDVDVINRMGDHVGPRPFVADLDAGFAGILPDAAEMRHPSSMAQFQAFQRILALLAANCES